MSGQRCTRCWFQQGVCVCGEVPTVVTRTRVVIVRHHREQSRSSNSGRLAHLALPNSVIIDHGGDVPGQFIPAVLPPLDGAWLLFPAGEPMTQVPEPPPAQLIVLDATWAQARRMYHKLAALRGLPILRLPDAPMPERRFRESPGPGKVSTIEAIARALRLLEGDAVATPLEELFQIAVERTYSMGRPLKR